MLEAGVRFRYAGIPAESGEVPGMCLQYQTEDDALRAFAVLQEYVSSFSGGRSMVVRLAMEERGGYRLSFSVETAGHSVVTEISGIDAREVRKLREGLAKFAYYVILAGHGTDEDFKLLPPKTYHLFKRDIIIDDDVVVGRNELPVDWVSLLK